MARKMSDAQKQKMQDARKAAAEGNASKPALPVLKLASGGGSRVEYVRASKIRIPRTTAPADVQNVINSILGPNHTFERVGGSLVLYTSRALTQAEIDAKAAKRKANKGE